MITMVYGFSRPTADLDVLEIAPGGESTAPRWNSACEAVRLTRSTRSILTNGTGKFPSVISGSGVGWNSTGSQTSYTYHGRCLNRVFSLPLRLFVMLSRLET